MQNNLSEILIQVGFSKNEALVFSCLSHESPLGASGISKKTNLARSSVYTILNSLSVKGLVGTTFENEIKKFNVDDGYATIKNYLKKQENQIEKQKQILESSENLFKEMETSTSAPSIIFFEGQEGLKKIYLSMLHDAPKNSNMLIIRDEFVWLPEWKFIFQSEWHETVKWIREDKNITTSLFINKSPIEKTKENTYKKTKYLQYAFLPDLTVQNFAIYIIHDTVSVMSTQAGNVVGIKIVNKNFAKNFSRLLSER